MAIKNATLVSTYKFRDNFGRWITDFTIVPCKFDTCAKEIVSIDEGMIQAQYNTIIGSQSRNAKLVEQQIQVGSSKKHPVFL